MIWPGEYGDRILVNGDLCLPLSSEFKTIDSTEMTVFDLEKIKKGIEINGEYLNPIYKKINNPFNFNLNLTKLFEIQAKKPNDPHEDTWKCWKCLLIVKHDRMRQHIGQHILNNEISVNKNLCGCCGKTGCKVILEKGSTKNIVKFKSSDCKYFININLKSAAKSTKYSPCTNRPIKCTICDGVYWSYNMHLHFSEDHPNINFPNQLQISDEEIKAVKKLVIYCN
jgi:hypothetical protein